MRVGREGYHRGAGTSADHPEMQCRRRRDGGAEGEALTAGGRHSAAPAPGSQSLAPDGGGEVCGWRCAR